MRGCALEDGCGGPVDLLLIGDVAELELAAELVRERLEPLLPPGDEHAVPATRRRARARLPPRCRIDAPVTTRPSSGRLLADAHDALGLGLAALRVGDDGSAATCRPCAAPPRFHAAE